MPTTRYVEAHWFYDPAYNAYVYVPSGEYDISERHIINAKTLTISIPQLRLLIDEVRKDGVIPVDVSTKEITKITEQLFNAHMELIRRVPHFDVKLSVQDEKRLNSATLEHDTETP